MQFTKDDGEITAVNCLRAFRAYLQIRTMDAGLRPGWALGREYTAHSWQEVSASDLDFLASKALRIHLEESGPTVSEVGCDAIRGTAGRLIKQAVSQEPDLA